MLDYDLLLYVSIIPIEMVPYTRPSRHIGGRNNSETDPSRRDHSDSSRRVNTMEESTCAVSSIDGNISTPTSLGQPKTILRMRVRQGPHDPRVSLVTGTFNHHGSGCPDKETGSREDASGNRNDRISWMQRLRPKPHRRTELAESHRPNAEAGMEFCRV